ncbi:MAG: C40 family peptidase [Bacteroidales bacterium]
MINKTIWYFVLCFVLIVFNGCKSKYQNIYKDQVRKAESGLGITIYKSDPLHLFLEVVSWIGTPYRSGGVTKKGADCSGFTFAIYKEVYGKKISRNSSDMYHHDCSRVRSKNSLKSGDLIFFRTGKDKRINHVGIYLKEGRFIHAATRGGIQVNSLDEPYYKKTVYRFGRIRQ